MHKLFFIPPTFETMTAAVKKNVHTEPLLHYQVDQFVFDSYALDRQVRVDVYRPPLLEKVQPSLLLVNDGQDLPKMPFAPLIDGLYAAGKIRPLMVVAMHCNEDRLLEYGTADQLDYLNRGCRARYHRKFVLHELIPYMRQTYHLPMIQQIGYAGFSLGGLSALDVVWKHPEIFNVAGVFSGSLWWRLKDLNDGYEESTDRIMHKLVREGKYADNLRFYFETGTQDETMDRNNNGIIDSIDDTLDLIQELEKKGYNREQHIRYLELQDGRHDIPTWARAFPDFLKWGWGK